MNIIKAVKCKECGRLNEPRNLVIIDDMEICVGSPGDEEVVREVVQKVNLRNEAFCDYACLSHFLKKELDEEILF